MSQSLSHRWILKACRRPTIPFLSQLYQNMLRQEPDRTFENLWKQLSLTRCEVFLFFNMLTTLPEVEAFTRDSRVTLDTSISA